MDYPEENLKNKKVGIIGVGTIGGTLVKTLIRNGVVSSDQFIGSTSQKKTAKEVSQKYNITACADNKRVVSEADIVILAVEPQTIELVLNETSSIFNDNQLVISVAAGTTTKFIESKIDGRTPVVRTMPNTAIRVKNGATVIVSGKHAEEKDMQLTEELFKPVGIVEVIRDESLMDAITGFSGSGPAYGYLIIESLIEAGLESDFPGIGQQI